MSYSFCDGNNSMFNTIIVVDKKGINLNTRVAFNRRNFHLNLDFI